MSFSYQVISESAMDACWGGKRGANGLPLLLREH